MVRSGVVRLQVKTELLARTQDLGKGGKLCDRTQDGEGLKYLETIRGTLNSRWGVINR